MKAEARQREFEAVQRGFIEEMLDLHKKLEILTEMRQVQRGNKALKKESRAIDKKLEKALMDLEREHSVTQESHEELKKMREVNRGEDGMFHLQQVKYKEKVEQVTAQMKGGVIHYREYLFAEYYHALVM